MCRITALTLRQAQGDVITARGDVIAAQGDIFATIGALAKFVWNRPVMDDLDGQGIRT